MFYKIDKDLNKRIPLFYGVMMDKALDVSELPEITEELSPEFSIGNIVKKKNQFSLFNYCTPRIKPMAETGVVFAGENSEEIGFISLDPKDTPTTELISRISDAAVAYIEMDKLNPENFYLSSFFRNEMALRIAILKHDALDSNIQNFVELLLQSSCQHVVFVKKSQRKLIESLLCKKVNFKIKIKSLSLKISDL